MIRCSKHDIAHVYNMTNVLAFKFFDVTSDGEGNQDVCANELNECITSVYTYEINQDPLCDYHTLFKNRIAQYAKGVGKTYQNNLQLNAK